MGLGALEGLNDSPIKFFEVEAADEELLLAGGGAQD